jgi:hypothetical protein
MATDTTVDLEQFRGRRWEIERELGRQQANDVLHAKFSGNAQAAGEFLGFADGKPVVRRWDQLGLECLGKDVPRRGYFAKWEERPISSWRQEYLRLSSQQEQALVYEWSLPRKTEVAHLVPISDLHCGSIGCDYKRFLDLVAWMKDRPEVRWFLGGDTFDLHTRSGPGSSAEQFCPLNVALEMVAEDLAPVAWQGIAVFDGNHERRLQRSEDVQFSPAEQLAQRLNLPFLGLCGHIVHKLGKQTYYHYHHHGRGAARTDGAKLNTGEAIAGTVTDELVTVGHLHIELSAKLLRREVDSGGEVGNITQRLAMLPSFQAYRGYASDQAYRPSALGACGIELGIREHKIRVI